MIAMCLARNAGCVETLGVAHLCLNVDSLHPLPGNGGDSFKSPSDSFSSEQNPSYILPTTSTHKTLQVYSQDSPSLKSKLACWSNDSELAPDK